MPDGSLAPTTGKSYEGSVLFNGKPKVFVTGSTGNLGRRVCLDLLRSGYSFVSGARDDGRIAEVGHENRSSNVYEQVVYNDNLISTGNGARMQEQLKDSAVVIHCAGARSWFDIFRPSMAFDNDAPERTDLNGTKELIDAAVATGKVKKFILISAVLTNGQALGPTVTESAGYRDWNKFGRVLEKKHAAEEYLKKSGLDYTIIRPSPMTQDFPRDAGGIGFKKPDTVLLEANEQVSYDDVSLAALDAIFDTKASGVTAELVSMKGKLPTPRDKWWM